MIVRDPRLAKERRGARSAALALNLDLPATFLDWAGVAVPRTYQGRSLRPLVESRVVSGWRTDFFCEHVILAPTLTWEGVRGERYVYARYFDQEPDYEFLHDLQVDPEQRKNFARTPKYRETLAKMRLRCDELVKKYGGALLPLKDRR